MNPSCARPEHAFVACSRPVVAPVTGTLRYCEYKRPIRSAT